MKENLRATKYNDGTPIPLVSANDAWKALTTPAYCFMNNDTANAKPYGALYNWYVVNSSKNVCPEGWHVPSKEEWETLTEYLGGYEVAGGKMKITGTEFWEEYNFGADNSSGFSVYPSGFRWGERGTFGGLRYSTAFWSSTNYGYDMACVLKIFSTSTGAPIQGSMQIDGNPIRCMQNINKE
jgi:uncharacterized protein (TIGR02145 family)